MTDRRRRWLHGLSIASAALSIGCTIMLVRMWVASDTVAIRMFGEEWQFQTHRGGLFLTIFDNSKAVAMPSGTVTWISESPAAARAWPEWNVELWEDAMLLGFGLTGGDGYTAGRVPIVYLMVMFAVLPIWWLRHPLHMARPWFGKCAHCGYDLRASSARCPECGEPFVRAEIVAPPPPAKRR